MYKDEPKVSKQNRIVFGQSVKESVAQLPHVILDATLHPLTDSLLRIRLTVTPDFTWKDEMHGTGCEYWWIWVEKEGEERINDRIIHCEFFPIYKQQVIANGR